MDVGVGSQNRKSPFVMHVVVLVVLVVLVKSTKVVLVLVPVVVVAVVVVLVVAVVSVVEVVVVVVSERTVARFMVKQNTTAKSTTTLLPGHHFMLYRF